MGPKQFTVEELREIHWDAMGNATIEGLSTYWKQAYLNLAMAADHLALAMERNQIPAHACVPSDSNEPPQEQV